MGHERIAVTVKLGPGELAWLDEQVREFSPFVEGRGTMLRLCLVYLSLLVAHGYVAWGTVELQVFLRNLRKPPDGQLELPLRKGAA